MKRKNYQILQISRFLKKVDNNSKFENVAKKIIKRYHETFEELAK